MADAWSRAMENERWYQAGYAKGIEHGMASPLDAINAERQRRGLIPLSRSENPRPEKPACKTYSGFGPSEILEHIWTNLNSPPRKDSSMAQEKLSAHYVLLRGGAVVETWSHTGEGLSTAKRRAEYLAGENRGTTYSVALVIGGARAEQPAIWTDYEE